MKKLKHILLKIIDITALGFLEPVVRLCYGEEPRVQAKKIGQFILIPVLVFALFVGLWAYVAPKHKTKSGEVPTPAVVWDAYQSILTFHERESAKEWGYLQTGATREAELAKARRRLSDLEPERAAAEAELTEAKKDHEAYLAWHYEPLLAEYEQVRDAGAAAAQERDASLKAEATAAGAVDDATRAAYLDRVAAHMARIDAERDAANAIKADADSVLKSKFPEIEAAQRKLSGIAAEQLFLSKLVEKLGEDNRELKIADSDAQLAKMTEAYASAEGEARFNAARLLMMRERHENVATSTYAKPWTLPMQITRSIYCVFLGFVIGTIIAVPIGVLCGLSKTFMAAVTPFIALFKPVSPIVWLPIFLIVIMGFFDNPDDHWLFKFLWGLPVIGWLKINPAFLASACTVAMCSLWATMVNTALGVASVDKDHLNVARVLRLGFWSRLFKIILPSALPLVFAGMRISLGVGWMVLIAAELLASSEGIGKFVWDQFNNGASDSFAKMMVVVFVVGFVGLLLDRVMIIFQRSVSFEGSVAAV